MLSSFYIDNFEKYLLNNYFKSDDIFLPFVFKVNKKLIKMYLYYRGFFMKVLRSRNYFLTCNMQANCYINFLQLVQQQNNCDYFLIYHNKGCENEHLHCVLLYYNAHAFTSIMKIFNGAHVEICREVSKCLGYLIHFGQVDKKQYDVCDVVSSVDYMTIFNKYCQIEELEPFNPNLLTQYMKECDNSIYLLCCRFGASAIKNYRALINDILKDSEYINICRKGDT